MDSYGRLEKVMEGSSQVTRVIVEHSRIVVEYINPMYL